MNPIKALAGDVLEAFRGLLASKKVWTAVLGAFATAWCSTHGCDPARVEELGQIVIALLIGQGAADYLTGDALQRLHTAVPDARSAPSLR